MEIEVKIDGVPNDTLDSDDIDDTLAPTPDPIITT